MAPALVGFQGLAVLRGGITAWASRAASLNCRYRPRLALGGGHPIISGSEQMVSDARFCTAALYAEQFAVLYVVGAQLLMRSGCHAGNAR